MTLLPQLERELLAAHGIARSRRRIDVRGALAVAAGVAVVVAVVVGIAGVGHRRTATAVRPPAAPAGAKIVVRGINAQVLHVGNSALYLSESTSTGTNLVHLDAISGHVICTVGFPGLIAHVLPAYGALWVTTSDHNRASLWKIDPNSGNLLAPNITLPGSGASDGDVGSLAATGGWMWVGNAAALIRVAPATGTISKTISIPAAHGVALAADRANLVLSVGDVRARLELRVPRTGTLLASSAPIRTDLRAPTKPRLGGLAGGGVWISVALGGAAGYVERVDLRTMKPVASTIRSGTGGIQAQVAAGVLWVTQFGGGPDHNYCGDPVTGQPRTTLPFLSDAAFTGANVQDVYYGSQNVVRAPIDPACR